MYMGKFIFQVTQTVCICQDIDGDVSVKSYKGSISTRTIKRGH